MNTIYRLQGNARTSVKIRYIYQAGKYLDKGYILLFINSLTYLRLWYAILKCTQTTSYYDVMYCED